jgi:hypothetical protein
MCHAGKEAKTRMNESELEAKIRYVVRDELRIILDKGLMYSAESVNAPTVKPQETKTDYIKDLQMQFPEDLETLLSFTEKGDYVILKPLQFLGSENFAKVGSIVRGLGGEYVSAGKDSHFRVRKKL